ncbi:hypothetical protein Nepgr_020410 [Nepenthes gracilis]|uniref:Uncharacterized protein n=1 Tax=Nepenthes gracilis TaxID=150966 RepID=A0AAD3XW15_NEPGR|nr:hypothetical protein Nepgr_020410 [Nepenthes gracilis]
MKSRFHLGKSRSNPSVQGDLELGSDKPLSEAVVPDSPSVVAGDFQSALSVPAEAPGTSNGVDIESGILPRVSAPREIMEIGLSAKLNADCPLSTSERSGYSMDVESVPEVGIPRVASCPALMQLYNQPFVPSAGCNLDGFHSLDPPAESLNPSPQMTKLAWMVLCSACIVVIGSPPILEIGFAPVGVCWRSAAQALIHFCRGHAAGLLDGVAPKDGCIPILLHLLRVAQCWCCSLTDVPMMSSDGDLDFWPFALGSH